MYQNLGLERRGDVFILTLQKPLVNRLTSQFCQEIIRALNGVWRTLGPGAPGGVIIRGNDAKFFGTGLDLYERDTNPYASSEGFYPTHFWRCLSDDTGPRLSHHECYPWVLVHAGSRARPAFRWNGCPSKSQAAIKIARKAILQGHKFTSSEALADGIVDEIASSEEMLNCALQFANRVKSKAKMGVYGLLRGELYGEALRAFQQISYVHSRLHSHQAKVKL
ncbi:hypothetical protein FocnCong_v001932 [Fusarium oxysporum f. sp. conglutinans]|nr:hypothetical protein FocnCong_v001932 [Fusarium oxysporum f. sp. conglutinans]